MDVIKRGVSEIIPEEDLARKIERSIASKTPLNIKLGCDPSRPDLHLGHSVVLRKLRQFQELGHQAILIIGDFTAMIGDPSGKSKTRPSLTLEETRQNGQTYFEQATKVLSAKNISMFYNSEWLGKMAFADVIRLASKYTVARMLERDDFTIRYKAGEPISIHEFLYPLAQAMDSVAIKADVELGGTDQKFNLLVGRDLQREYGLEPQVALTMPILTGTDGVEKMSKSLDNYVGVSDTPKDIYGKTLRVPDTQIVPWFELLTDVTNAELVAIRKSLAAGTNPRDVKRRLARTLVALYHSDDDARAAEEEFDRIFIQKSVPDDLDETTLAPDEVPPTTHALLSQLKLAASNSEARRLIEQGGVTIDGEKVGGIHDPVPSKAEFVLKVGKRRFMKVIISPRP
ncbi:MAG: tyrosine--tRNA ligase [Bacteroidetes bacterium]|jgi:tyrosyl-tRNA synthetase|nr:tyrosine--tRNA ligase [Bacteroidota bacterium]